MATFSKLIFSASTNGRGVLVTATASVGTTITAAHATSEDEIWVWAMNQHTSSVELTLEWGDAYTEDWIVIHVPFDAGLQQVIPGLILTGSAGLKAYASVASKITLHGYVNRITP